MNLAPIDITKPYRTYNGCAVEFFCDNLKDASGQPIAGRVTDQNGKELICQWTIHGKYVHDSCSTHWLDLVPVAPEPKVAWLNEYHEGSPEAFLSYGEAFEARDSACSRVAVKYVEAQ